MGEKEKARNCADCFNTDNEWTEADYLVLNHPFYPNDVYVCRHHLAVMFDWFTHGSDAEEITIIRLKE